MSRMNSNANSSLTGYGPSRFQRLLFDGNEESYQLWETKFLAYLNTLTPNLKAVITSAQPVPATIDDNKKNERAHLELIQSLMTKVYC